MRGYPNVALRVYGHYGRGCDLGFLKHFPFLRRFQVDVYELQDIDGFRYLPDNLEYLGFFQTKSMRFSLAGSFFPAFVNCDGFVSSRTRRILRCFQNSPLWKI